MNATIFVSDLFYFPSVSWYAMALQADAIHMPHANYNKSYHLNKTTIATAHGAKHLSVPLLGGRNQRATDVQIGLSYAEDWRKLHLKTMASTYGRAPFFENVYPLLQQFYTDTFDSLYDSNLQSILLLNKLLGLQFHFIDTTVLPNYAAIPIIQQAYQQVFADKTGFIPNCSMLDLVMNEGRFAKQIVLNWHK
jgi:hypothetical protein